MWRIARRYGRNFTIISALRKSGVTRSTVPSNSILMGCKTVVRQQGQPLKRRSGEWEDLASLDKLVLRRDAWGPHTDSRLPHGRKRCVAQRLQGQGTDQDKSRGQHVQTILVVWATVQLVVTACCSARTLLPLLGKKRLNIQALTLGCIYVLLGMQLHPQSAAYNYKSGQGRGPSSGCRVGEWRPRDYTLVVRSLSMTSLAGLHDTML
jgi:hypothetical protein